MPSPRMGIKVQVALPPRQARPKEPGWEAGLPSSTLSSHQLGQFSEGQKPSGSGREAWQQLEFCLLLVQTHFKVATVTNHSDYKWVREPQAQASTCLGLTADQTLLRSVTLHSEPLTTHSHFSRPSGFSSPCFLSRSPSGPWRREVGELSHLTRQSDSSTGRQAGQGEARAHRLHCRLQETR